MLPEILFIKGLKNYKLVLNRKDSMERIHLKRYDLIRIDEEKLIIGYTRRRLQITKKEIYISNVMLFDDNTDDWELQLSRKFHVCKCYICNKKGLFEDMISLETRDLEDGYNINKKMIHINCYPSGK